MPKNRRSVTAPFKLPEFGLQPLEGRVMLSAAIITPATVLNKGIRETLLSEWNGPDKAQLTTDLLHNNLTGFDSDLLSYMTTRTDASFYFSPGQVNSDLNYINSELGDSTIIGTANDVVNHMFPNSANATDSSTTQLPAGNVDWSTGGNTDFTQNLNRQAFWISLAEAYQLTGNTSYSTELSNELASWSSQSPALANANDWTSAEPNWDLLGTSTRATNWTWTYALTIGSSGWTAAENTLFLYKTEETGDFLRNAAPEEIDDNRAVVQYSGLVQLADLFPEFTNAPDWSSYGHHELFYAEQSTIFPDGSYIEQSPAYAEVVIDSLLDTKLLDQDNNYTWPTADTTLLNNGVTAFEQMLSPNGETAAIGDTYRESTAPLWLKADLILGTDAYNAGKPRADDVLMFGVNVASENSGNPITPNLADRGLTYAEPDAGVYVMRSGSDPDANQITFMDGPKGGNHGHYAYNSFELSGYGHTLISDPGMVSEDASSARTYAISEPAQNSVSADGLNPADLEGDDNPGLVIDQWDPTSNSVQITASQDGYAYLSGSPDLTRSIWYDYGGTMLVVDWAEGTASHDYTAAFNLPGTAAMNSDDSIQSTNGDGDVKITPLLTSGMKFAAVNSFVSNTASPDESPAIQYQESEKGNFVAFANLITTYSGSTPPDTTATVVGTPTAGHSVTIALTENGVTQDVTFTPPQQVVPDKHGTVAASNVSIAFDSSGALHMAYYDPTTGHLYYTVRGTSGIWSPVQLVDDGPLVGQDPSLALDSNGNPGIAYYDATNADLKYAYLSSSSNSWQVQTVDSYGTVGEDPSLAFSRNNGAAISYYDATHHALKLALTSSTGWTISVVDKSADVGRYSSMSLDPSRPTASKWAISYNDTTHGTIKFAIQEKSSWTITTVGTGSGPTSLAFDSSLEPAIGYYDRKDAAVEVARYDAKAKTFSSTAVTASSGGTDPNLYFNKSGAPVVLFASTVKDRVIEAVQKHSTWTETALGSGNSSLDIALSGGTLAYTEGDAADDLISVGFT
jgi:hypothetical protein